MSEADVTAEQLEDIRSLKGITREVYDELQTQQQRLADAAAAWGALAEADGNAPAWEDLAEAVREAAGLLDQAATILDQQGLT